MNTTENSEQPEHRIFAQRMHNIPKSFIREMLKTASSKNIISFAGGLPDENLIPTAALQKAFTAAVKKHGNKLFQYSNSEGYLPLREWIARRYQQRFDLQISPEEILLTNGSQQALDLLGKVFIEKGDKVIIEQPGYLGTIQSMMHFEPELLGVPLENDGIDTEKLERVLENNTIKMLHLIPNFQNPSGIVYSELKRNKIAQLLESNRSLLVEDDPYGELYFDEKTVTVPLKKTLPENILLGSFSKTLSPGIRLGWIVAPKTIMEKIIIAKQAGDLHTNNISQMMAYEYLISNDYEQHLSVIRNCYRERKDTMVEAIEKYLSPEISFSNPEGGMFLWCRLPNDIPATKLVQLTMDAGVVMVPGSVFHLNASDDHCFRLNFSKSEKEEIVKGLAIIGKSIAYLNSKNKIYPV